ncbi:hypothetical protein H0H92_006135 [Tricholoma furcatifolium]|nr:hypothetical protein H0H92_006135 [Tricholoma furcatifolium]
MAHALRNNGTPPTTVMVTWEIASGLQPEDSELKEVLRNLASNVSLLGTPDYFPFGCWESLVVSLPFQALPFDPNGILTLPVESLTKLRALFPLDSALLQKLEFLYIRTPIPAEDCINIMRKATKIKELWIDGLVGPPPSPTTATPNEVCLPLLKELWITAYTDVASVLKVFQFPVLHFTTLWLHDNNTTSGIPDLTNLNWDSPASQSQCGPPNRKTFLPLAIEWLDQLRKPDTDEYRTRKRIMRMLRGQALHNERREEKKDGDGDVNGNIDDHATKKDEGDVNDNVGNDGVQPEDP